MGRLIDAEPVIKRLTSVCLTDDCFGLGIQMGINRAMEILGEAKIVDAVEVVRCKDCKHSVWDKENEMWKCVESAEYDEDAGEWFGFYEYHNGDFFCADGERKDNG